MTRPTPIDPRDRHDTSTTEPPLDISVDPVSDTEEGEDVLAAPRAHVAAIPVDVREITPKFIEKHNTESLEKPLFGKAALIDSRSPLPPLFRARMEPDDNYVEKQTPKVMDVLRAANLGFFTQNGFRGLRLLLLEDPYGLFREDVFGHTVRRNLLKETPNGLELHERWRSFLVLLLSRSGARFDAELVARCLCGAAGQVSLAEAFMQTANHS